MIYSESLSDIRKTYPKYPIRFQKYIFLGRISKLAVVFVCMLEIQNVLDFSSQCFGYGISDIVSDVRKDFRICCNASPNIGINS